jgi:hypothetical protein
MKKCPACNSYLIKIYNPNDPSLLKEYACFGCGRTYDLSTIKFYSGERINFTFILEEILKKRHNLKDFESLCWAVRKELEKYGIHLTQNQNMYLNKLVKKLTNNF